jgi:hypothetical protein
LTDSSNKIENPQLSTSLKKVKPNEQVAFRIDFRIEGEIRQVFDQKNWERAYNLHDNIFRIKIDVDLKSGSKKLLHSGSFRKASLFWTRNPKLPYRIWSLIVKDDTTFYPSSIEEVKSLLFDVEKEIIVKASQFDLGKHEIHAQIRVWWGKHQYTVPCELKAKTNKVSLLKVL